MSTELAVRHATLPEKIAYAKAMADSNLLPRHYQRQPANLLIALEYAEAFGISPINAISSVFVIDGKPSASADLIAALVRRAGHKLRVAGDDKHAVAEIIRADDPEFTYTATWDLDKARQAGLLGKGTWKSYPAALLRARAITEVARMGASDALFGVLYSPEEIGATVTEDGTPVIDGQVVESSGRDWFREASELDDPEALRNLYRECNAWGEMTEVIAALIAERGAQLTAKTKQADLAYVEAPDHEPIHDVGELVEVSEDQASLDEGDPWTQAAK